MVILSFLCPRTEETAPLSIRLLFFISLKLIVYYLIWRYQTMSMYKHLIPDQRANLMLLLESGWSYGECAKQLGVSKSTISREVKRNIRIKEYDLANNECHKLGQNFMVCNNCPFKKTCSKNKSYYDSQFAQYLASERKHKANNGPRISLATFKKIDDELYRLVVVQGLSIEASHKTSKILQQVSCSTIRNWVNAGYMKTKPINLKTKKKLKYKSQYDYKKQKKSLNIVKKPFRTMTDYKAYMSCHPDSIVIQTDSVEGLKTDKKAVLTILLKAQKFQIGYLYERKDAAKNVYEYLVKFTLKMIEKTDENKSIVFVTDNGVEFTTISKLEDLDPRIRVYFARPYCSTDKADCERNHELYRYIYPKGHTQNNLTQTDVDDMFSNINSYVRKSLEWKSPCNLIAETYGDDFLSEFNISNIAPDKVNLRPKF